MSDIQRWDMNHVQGEVYIDKKPEGSWVTYADHLAAVAAARAEMADECEHHNHDAFTLGKATARAEMAEPLDHLITFAEGAQSTAYAAGLAKGQRDEREAAAQRVEALRNHWNGQHDVVQLNAAVSAVRGDSDE